MALHDVFRHNARLYANRTAICIDHEARTYQQLSAMVDDTIRLLAPQVSRGDRVGLWLHNSFSWVACFIALSELGAVSVPINTRLTGTELRTLVQDAGLRVLVTTTAYRGRSYDQEAIAAVENSDRFATPTVIVASDHSLPAQWQIIEASSAGIGSAGRASALELFADAPADLLCIQYTSGTTSTPKGVMLTHEGYLLTASYVARCQRLTPSSQFISAGPFFHCSGSMHAITTCLVAGSTLHSMSVWDPEIYLDLVKTGRCDVSHMVYYRDVLALNVNKARDQLKTMQIAHDLGTREYLLRLHDELGIQGISNIYGMTETAGQFTMWSPDDPLESRLSANGRTQPGNEVRIGSLEAEGSNALPADAIGEIQMRGRTLSPGYFNQPEATAAAWTADGWLRSGDLGRLTPQGELVYIARHKEIIRVGGENLAPAEVEQVMRDLCNLQQVCVLGVPDARLGEVPAAVVVADHAVVWGDLLRLLRPHLAGFKIPKEIYLVDSFPVTGTNKVQRSVLKNWIAEGRLVRVV